MPTINFSGIASGIDTDSLIKTLTDSARSQRVKPNEDKITRLNETSSAITELKAKTDDLRTKLLDFSSLEGGAIIKQGTSSDETIISASASKTASKGTYTVTVSQRAKNATFSFNDRFATTSTVIDGTINNGAADDPDRTVSFSIGTSSPQTIKVPLTNTTTVSGFVTAFNSAAIAAGGRATASAVNVGTVSSPSFAIVINSANEGLESGQITLNAVGTEIAPAFAANTLSQATNATLSVSGISGTISRATNSVTDVIAGVTLNLNALGTTTISITDDATATAGKVREWVDTYNEIVTFISENNRITREEDGANVTNVFAPLSTQRVDDNFLSQLRSNLSAARYTGSTAVNVTADLGFKTNRDGTITFDGDVFEEAVASESASANGILLSFADASALTGGTIDLHTRFNGLFDTVTNSNRDQISDLNKRIAEAEAAIARQEESQRARFARLEGVIGRMNSQQQALTSALSGLGR
jgi:flagellar hook-associated protein 2